MIETENNDPTPASSRGELIFSQPEDGQPPIECRFEDATIWLSRALMDNLYRKAGVAKGSECRSDK